MLAVFLPIFVVNTKIIFQYDFKAPLKIREKFEVENFVSVAI